MAELGVIIHTAPHYSDASKSVLHIEGNAVAVGRASTRLESEASFDASEQTTRLGQIVVPAKFYSAVFGFGGSDIPKLRAKFGDVMVVVQNPAGNNSGSFTCY